MSAADRLKEHARVQLLSYWIIKDGEKLQLPNHKNGNFCGHFGDVMNFALKRALRELNYPWVYNAEEDRIGIKYYDDIEKSFKSTFQSLSLMKDIHLENEVVLGVYCGRDSNNNVKGFSCQVLKNEDDNPLDYLEFVVGVKFKMV